MKILFLDTEPIRRGAQVFISELSSFLGQKGETCKVLYLYKIKNSDHKNLSNSDTKKVLEGDKASVFERIPGINPALMKRLIFELKEYSPDVIVCNGSRTLKYAAVAKLFYHKEARWIARWIDDAAFWNPNIVSKWIYENVIMSQFDGCIGVSQASLDSMIRHYNFKKPTQVIHRAFDPKKFQHAPSREEARRNLGFKESDEVLLFLGNLTSQKRPDRFIEIVQKLAQTRPNLKALLVGDGPLRKELEGELLKDNYQSSKIEEGNQSADTQETSDENSSDSQPPSSVNQHPTSDTRHPTCDTRHPTPDTRHQTPTISFTGYQQDVSAYLAAADILLLTSDTEGLPGVVLEAAYFAVPTVATEVGGIAECLIDGETGVLVSDRSVTQFCKRLNHLLDHPAERVRMGESAQIFTDKNFKMERVARQYVDFFKQLLQ